MRYIPHLPPLPTTLSYLVVVPPEQQEMCEEVEDADVCGVQLIGAGEKLETISKTLRGEREGGVRGQGGRAAGETGRAGNSGVRYSMSPEKCRAQVKCSGQSE